MSPAKEKDMVSSEDTLQSVPQLDKTIRVLIVDDSVVMRRLLVNMLSAVDGIEVVGSARDGADALQKLKTLKPDLLTLDVEMPGANGIEVLRRVRREHPGVRVIMCSSMTVDGSSTTVDALLAGADDFVTKQSCMPMGGDAYEALQSDLLYSIHRLYTLGQTKPVEPRRRPPQAPAVAMPKPSLAIIRPEVLAIGVSTGGPELLARILPDLPAHLSVPVVMVQHMPPFFTQLLAERLTKLCNIPVFEAQDGMEVVAGQMLLAPGNFHMRLVREDGYVRVRLDQGERENSCRPAVDVLFRSVADVYGPASLAVVLTGMGEDGMRGARVLKDKGAQVLAQDEETSVVWGMPGAVVNAGLATAVLPANKMIAEVMRRL
jgi:two-component system chemotaxis response regulator CheB